MVDFRDGGAFAVEASATDGQAVLRLMGELDTGTAPVLAAATARAHQQGAHTIVLDLSQLRFVDSSGLHEFVIALVRQRQSGGDVVLRGPTVQTARVLDITGLNRVFTTES